MNTNPHVSIACAILCLLPLNSCSADVRQSSAENVSARGRWSTLAPMPIEISEVTVAASGGKIYVIGGSTGDVVDQRLNQEYDIATNRWRNRAPLPRG
ncbi:MAG: kelch repeat-containing protein, partial [Candidatus Binatia bacterium]